MPTRRQFLRDTVAASVLLTAHQSLGQTQQRPNILWLTCEDTGPELGCYGDTYATTPNVNAFAARGLRYDNCWSNAPVCAPARTTIISGLYPTCTGSEHMRSLANLPAGFKMYPQFLREAGYYCTNNVKEDFNLEKPEEIWDDVSKTAHWKNRPAGAPFFAIFNQTVTHESQIRKRPHTPVHDPAKAPIPPYHPDAPEVRQDWAQYYDNLTTMDTWFSAELKELEDAGLAEDTIVFFYGDHGSGMPRHKRWLYTSGLRVPLIVYVPPKFRALAPKDYAPGAATDRLVGFIDLAPTVLSIAGIEVPHYYQGTPFMGTHIGPESQYLYGFRGRMDERYDLSRAVRNKRYLYIRNYMPHRPWGQHQAYMFETPATRAWKDRYDKGELNEVQRRFWEKKPYEELYDLEADPFNVTSLVASAEHDSTLKELRGALNLWQASTRDLGFLPETEIHSRSTGRSPYEMGHDSAAYNYDRVAAVANAAASMKTDTTPTLVKSLADPDSAVRYWAAMGLLIREADGVNAGRDDLRRVVAEDPSPSVRVIAAEALGRYGKEEDVTLALPVLLEIADANRHGYYAALLALNAIDELDAKALPIADQLASFAAGEKLAPERLAGKITRVIVKTLTDLDKPIPEGLNAVA